MLIESTNHTLSPTEEKIAAILMTGASNKTIARQLGIADGTVKVHMKAILKKTNTSNRTQCALALLPYARGLLSGFSLMTREEWQIEAAMTAEFSGPLVLMSWQDTPRPNTVRAVA